VKLLLDENISARIVKYLIQDFPDSNHIDYDLVRKVRAKEDEIELIRNKLIQAEINGFVSQSKREMLSEFKKDLTIEQEL